MSAESVARPGVKQPIIDAEDNGLRRISARQLSQLERKETLATLQGEGLVSEKQLKFARKVLGLRQMDLAERLGVTTETVSRWETGVEPFKRHVQLAISKLLEDAIRMDNDPT
jgi:DNA-binding transcriptional regulator YiaG